VQSLNQHTTTHVGLCHKNSWMPMTLTECDLKKQFTGRQLYTLGRKEGRREGR